MIREDKNKEISWLERWFTVKNSYCSCRGTEFRSLHPCWAAHNSLKLQAVDGSEVFAFHEHLFSCAHSHIHTHVHIIKTIDFYLFQIPSGSLGFVPPRYFV